MQVFRRLWLNLSVHLDYFIDVFINFMISFIRNNFMEKQSRFLLKNTSACFDDDMTFVFGWTKLIMLQSKKSMFEMSWKWKDTIPCRTGCCSWTSWCSSAQIKKIMESVNHPSSDAPPSGCRGNSWKRKTQKEQTIQNHKPLVTQSEHFKSIWKPQGVVRRLRYGWKDFHEEFC